MSISEELRERLRELAHNEYSIGYISMAEIATQMRKILEQEAPHLDLAAAGQVAVGIAKPAILDITQHIQRMRMSGQPSALTRLIHTFEDLSKRGVLCLECPGFIIVDAVNRFHEIFEDMEREGSPRPRGVVFFVRSDARVAYETGILRINVLDPFCDPDEALASTGRLIQEFMKVAEAQGLVADWDEDPESQPRIVISDWVHPDNWARTSRATARYALGRG